MICINEQLLLGRIGKDGELRYIGSGKAVLNFSMATSEQYKNDAGTKQESTVWHSVVVWGKVAEAVAPMCKKGVPVLVKGRTNNRSYNTKDGAKRYVTEVVVDGPKASIIMLGDTSALKAEENQDGAGAPVDSQANTEDQLPF